VGAVRAGRKRARWYGSRWRVQGPARERPDPPSEVDPTEAAHLDHNCFS
jgi:hypothetical protein